MEKFAFWSQDKELQRGLWDEMRHNGAWGAGIHFPVEHRSWAWRLSPFRVSMHTCTAREEGQQDRPWQLALKKPRRDSGKKAPLKRLLRDSSDGLSCSLVAFKRELWILHLFLFIPLPTFSFPVPLSHSDKRHCGQGRQFLPGSTHLTQMWWWRPLPTSAGLHNSSVIVHMGVLQKVLDDRIQSFFWC